MTVSKVQIELWKIREELDQKLAKMTPEERHMYFEGTLSRIREKGGVELDLPEVDPGQDEPVGRPLCASDLRP